MWRFWVQTRLIINKYISIHLICWWRRNRMNGSHSFITIYLIVYYLISKDAVDWKKLTYTEGLNTKIDWVVCLWTFVILGCCAESLVDSIQIESILPSHLFHFRRMWIQLKDIFMMMAVISSSGGWMNKTQMNFDICWVYPKIQRKVEFKSEVLQRLVSYLHTVAPHKRILIIKN